MDPNKALENLYMAVRQISANAEIHEQLSKCYSVLKQHLENGVENASD